MHKWLGPWVLISLFTIVTAAEAGERWPQWGGPDRDFTVEGRELARDWADGPPVLWTKPLGGGFASIVSDGRRLYTAFRDGDVEVVIALDPKSGETKWEHRYPAPVPKRDSLSIEYGKGPNATPLLIGGKIVTLGFMGHLRCLDAAKGKLLWSYDLGKQYEVEVPYFGHAVSPLTVGKSVVIVAGGLFAFDLNSGEVVWQNREFEGSYGSPRLVTAGGSKQIVTPVSGHLAGFDPKTGKTLWSEEHKNQWGTILTSPVVDASGRVFISAAGVGSILVDPAATKDTERQVWKGEKTQVSHTNAVLDGDWIYASTGGRASFMTATSMKDGSQAWKERGFAQANLLRVGDDFLLLDFDGELALLELSADGMAIVTQASVNDEPTWTPPTLMGKTLYIRDETRIVALDLR